MSSKTLYRSMEYGLSEDLRGDKRQVKWAKQREERGFDDTELWNLDKTFIRFIYPRLKAYQETFSHEDNFKGDLEELVEQFKELFDNIDNTFNGVEQDKAFSLLAKLNGELWD